MIAPSLHTKVYLAKDADRHAEEFPGLIVLTEAVLRQEPTSGHLFMFLNRRRDMMKILYWDGTGFCIWAKRLERGSFQRPPAVARRAASLPGTECDAMVDDSPGDRPEVGAATASFSATPGLLGHPADGRRILILLPTRLDWV